MDIEIKKKWTDALRSGEYKKNTGKLYNKENDSYCIMGVLAKVLGLSITEDGMYIVGDATSGQGYYPSMDKIVDGKTSQIVFKNDAYKMSFSEMANWIDNEL